MSVFIWADTARNSLCGFCVRKVFERKHERENKSSHCSLWELLLPLQCLKLLHSWAPGGQRDSQGTEQLLGGSRIPKAQTAALLPYKLGCIISIGCPNHCFWAPCDELLQKPIVFIPDCCWIKQMKWKFFRTALISMCCYCVKACFQMCNCQEREPKQSNQVAHKRLEHCVLRNVNNTTKHHMGYVSCFNNNKFIKWQEATLLCKPILLNHNPPILFFSLFNMNTFCNLNMKDLSRDRFWTVHWLHWSEKHSTCGNSTLLKLKAFSHDISFATKLNCHWRRQA